MMSMKGQIPGVAMKMADPTMRLTARLTLAVLAMMVISGCVELPGGDERPCDRLATEGEATITIDADSSLDLKEQAFREASWGNLTRIDQNVRAYRTLVDGRLSASSGSDGEQTYVDLRGGNDTGYLWPEEAQLEIAPYAQTLAEAFSHMLRAPVLSITYAGGRCGMHSGDV